MVALVGSLVAPVRGVVALKGGVHESVDIGVVLGAAAVTFVGSCVAAVCRAVPQVSSRIPQVGEGMTLVRVPLPIRHLRLFVRRRLHRGRIREAVAGSGAEAGAVTDDEGDVRVCVAAVPATLNMTDSWSGLSHPERVRWAEAGQPPV